MDSRVESKPDTEQILAAVANILRSPLFGDSPKKEEFLRYVVEKALNGENDELTAKRLAFQLYKDIDAENKLIQLAKNVRVALKSFYQEEGASESVEIVIPKGGYTPIFRFLVRGETEDVAIEGGPEKNRPKFSRRAILICLGILFALIVGFAVGSYSSSSGSQTRAAGPHIEVYYPKEIYSHIHTLFGDCSTGEYRIATYVSPEDGQGWYWLQPGFADAKGGTWSLTARFGNPFGKGHTAGRVLSFVIYVVMFDEARASALPGGDKSAVYARTAEEFEHKLSDAGVVAFKRGRIVRQTEKCIHRMPGIVSPAQPDSLLDTAELDSLVTFEWAPNTGYAELYKDGELRPKESERIRTVGSGIKLNLEPGLYEFKIKEAPQSECESTVWFKVVRRILAG